MIKLKNQDIIEYIDKRRLFYKYTNNKTLYFLTLETDNFGFNITDVTFILRPFSDIYKIIIHNGKEICPIVELAKIIFPSTKWKLLEENYNNTIVYSVINEKKELRFFNDKGIFKLTHINFTDDEYEILHYYKIFDYLHELKIDYKNLIENKLVISVYDLPENPYK